VGVVADLIYQVQVHSHCEGYYKMVCKGITTRLMDRSYVLGKAYLATETIRLQQNRIGHYLLKNEDLIRYFIAYYINREQITKKIAAYHQYHSFPFLLLSLLLVGESLSAITQDRQNLLS
jgi:hypothetical protein